MEIIDFLFILIGLILFYRLVLPYILFVSSKKEEMIKLQWAPYYIDLILSIFWVTFSFLAIYIFYKDNMYRIEIGTTYLIVGLAFFYRFIMPRYITKQGIYDPHKFIKYQTLKAYYLENKKLVLIKKNNEKCKIKIKVNQQQIDEIDQFLKKQII